MSSKEFESIYITYYREIYLFAKYKLRNNHHDAEDVVSYVFMKLWETQPITNRSLSILIWLRSVANRRVIDAYRSKYRNSAPLEDEDTTPDHYQVDSIYNHIQINEIAKLTNKLSPKYKAVFSLYFFSEFSPAEICKKMGANNQTIRNELSTIRKKIIKWMC